MIETTIADAVRAAMQPEMDRLASELAELRAAVATPRAEPLMTRRQVAEWAGCSVRVVDGWIAAGCPHVRLGGPGGSPRMRASELMAWLAGRG